MAKLKGPTSALIDTFGSAYGAIGSSTNSSKRVAVVVAQLVNLSLPTPEVRSSKPVIGKFLYGTFVYCQLYWKDENK